MILPISLKGAEMETVPDERGASCRDRPPVSGRALRPRIFSTWRKSSVAAKSLTLRFDVRSWRECWPPNQPSPVPRRRGDWEFTNSSYENGDGDGRRGASSFRTCRGPGGLGFSPPIVIAAVKGIACELPAQHRQPLSRLFVPDIQRILLAEDYVESISTSTIWRILDADALKPWRKRSWIWSRDPLFFERAAPVLDLYQGIWKGRHLRCDEFVLSADEKTSIQARIRLHPTEVHADGRGQRVEHEYERGGAWTYLAALDVHLAKVIGRVEHSNGIAPFDRLIAQVMNREPYVSARRVFWIVDQGSSHRPTTFPERLRREFPNAVAVSLPVHASWLNQIEIYFSILERKALTPNDFRNLEAVADRIRNFEKLFKRMAKPFNWRFTRADLRALLKRIPRRWSDAEQGVHTVKGRLRPTG
jgi:hypothetical protein